MRPLRALARQASSPAAATPAAPPAGRAFVTRHGQTLSFPRLGLGTAPLGGLFSAVTAADAAATLAAGLAAGMHYVDTAPLYGFGDAERRAGAFLRAHTAAGGATPLVSTKVGRLLSPAAPATPAASGVWAGVPSRRAAFDYSYDGVMRSFEASLERMGVDGVDILLIHDADAYTHGAAGAAAARRALLDGATGGLRALQALRASGAVRAIGAGLNDVADCAALLAAAPRELDVLLLAGHFSLLGQAAAPALLPECAAQGVAVVFCGPFESGILATGAVPGATFKYAPASPEVLARTAALQRACAAHGVPLASASLAFPATHPAVVCVLAGARSPAEVARNTAAAAVPVPDALWRQLRGEGLIA